MKTRLFFGMVLLTSIVAAFLVGCAKDKPPMVPDPDTSSSAAAAAPASDAGAD